MLNILNCIIVTCFCNILFILLIHFILRPAFYNKSLTGSTLTHLDIIHNYNNTFNNNKTNFYLPDYKTTTKIYNNLSKFSLHYFY